MYAPPISATRASPRLEPPSEFALAPDWPPSATRLAPTEYIPLRGYILDPRPGFASLRSRRGKVKIPTKLRTTESPPTPAELAHTAALLAANERWILGEGTEDDRALLNANRLLHGMEPL